MAVCEAVAVDVVGWILRCRREAELSQRDLAALLGVSPSTVARWELGQCEPTVTMMARIASVAGHRLVVAQEEASFVPAEARAEPVVPASDSRQGPVAPGGLTPVAPWPQDPVRDRAGRRLPAHLDVLFTCDGRVPGRREWISHGREVFSVRRESREWWRQVVPTFNPCRIDPTPKGVRLRRFDDMATTQDVAQWHVHRRMSRTRYLHWGFGPHPLVHDDTPACECELDCHESGPCVESCPCQCEVAQGQVPGGGGPRLLAS